MTWESLINDLNVSDKKIEKQKIKSLLYEIAEGLSVELRKEDVPFDFIRGKAGALLFLAEFRTFFQDDKFDEIIIETAGLLFDCLENKPMNASFSYGLSGIGFVFLHLIKKGILSEDDFHPSFFEALDESILDGIRRNNREADLELLTGNAGIALYFLERGEQSKKRAFQLQLEGLWSNKISTENGVKWRTFNSIDPPFYCLGLAHGVPAMLAHLGMIYESNVDNQKCLELLTQGVNALMGEELTDEIFSFPQGLPLEEELPRMSSGNTRIAWCYGDLGIALSLLKAGLSTNNESWCKKALQIAEKVTQRDPRTSCIMDNAFCHGSLGVVHIYNRFYQFTKDIRYKEQALYWLNHALKMAEPLKGMAKFHSKERDKDTNEYKIAPHWGILEGTTGAGLVLLSLLADKEPEWDKVFYTDIRPKSERITGPVDSEEWRTEKINA